MAKASTSTLVCQSPSSSSKYAKSVDWFVETLLMVEKYCGLTPFVTWVYSLCRPVGFFAHLITQRNHLLISSTHGSV